MKSIPLPLLSESQAVAQKPDGWPALRLGFRPFYLGAAGLAAVGIPLWLAVFLAGVELTTTVPGLFWHAHEMLFGFAAAVIVGFLMTAGQNWTGLATPRGSWLACLVLWWLAGRLAVFTGSALLYGLLDVTWLPMVAAVLTRLLWRARNFRNLPLVVFLVLLGLANLCFHLAVHGVIDLSPLSPLHAALALILMMESVIGGRVIPAFTMAANPGVKLLRQPWLEWTTFGLTAVALSWWVFAPAGWPGAWVLGAAGMLHLRRLLGWQPQLSAGKPLLWILHAAYAWFPFGLVLLALAQVGAVPDSAGVHALAVGVTGGLIIGMMTRTARGHTGRPLVPSKAEVLAYALVLASALLRVLVPLVAPGLTSAALMLAGIAWSLAFLIYLWQFSPWLLQARLDGKNG